MLTESHRVTIKWECDISPVSQRKSSMSHVWFTCTTWNMIKGRGLTIQTGDGLAEMTDPLNGFFFDNVKLLSLKCLFYTYLA